MLKSYRWWWVGGGPCDFSVSPSPFGLDFGTLDFGLWTWAWQKLNKCVNLYVLFKRPHPSPLLLVFNFQLAICAMNMHFPPWCSRMQFAIKGAMWLNLSSENHWQPHPAWLPTQASSLFSVSASALSLETTTTATRRPMCTLSLACTPILRGCLTMPAQGEQSRYGNHANINTKYYPRFFFSGGFSMMI